MSTINLNKHITIIKDKLHQLQLINKRIQLNSCLPEKKINAFEKEYNIVLPEDYKLFLLEVGNGGSGPDYGLYSLKEATVDSTWYIFADQIHKPFFFQKSWLCNKEHEEMWLDNNWVIEWFGPNYTSYIYDIPEDIDFQDGCIILCDHGCATLSQLVITGNQKGIVWDITNSGSNMLSTNKNFLAWYEEWIDKEIKYTDEKLNEIKGLQNQLILEPKSVKLHYEIGSIYYLSLGDIEKADPFFNTVLELKNLDSSYNYRTIAAQKYEKQDQQTSIYCANKALELLEVNDGNYQYKSELYQGIGQSYYLLKQFSAAIEYFQKAINEIADKNYEKCEELHFWIARAYFGMKQPNKTIEFLQKSSQDKWTYNLFSNAYAELKDWDNCLKFYKKTIEIDPEWIVPKDNIGYYSSLMGDYDKAIKIHKEVIKEDPTYSWGYYNMAVAYALQNKIEDALPYFIKAIQLGYDKEDIKKDKDVENLRNTELYKQLINH